MPRCYSCGAYVKVPHREVDGRTERAYCDLCFAERDWKFDDSQGRIMEPKPRPSWWEKFKRFFKIAS